jgi:Rrf2 family transcriptional regulator, cysteine metabolism repressor
MQFSTRAEYGLKAIVNLAKCYPEQKNIKTISKEEGISVKYLERLVNELRKKNMVKSQKGKSGGYTLAKNPKLIRVGEIIETLEGSISPMKCFGKKCVLEHACSSSVVWNKLGEQIRKTLYGIKLSDLI